MLKGYSFHYTLIVALIAALLCTSLILISGFYRNYRTHLTNQSDLSRSFSSALAYCLGKYDDFDNQKVLSINENTVALKKVWGFWDVLTVKILLNDSTHIENYFIGHDEMSKHQVRLQFICQIAEKYYLLQGDTRIEGNVYVPNQTVKRGYIDGLNLTSDKLVYGEIYSSKKELPKIKEVDIQDVLNNALVPEFDYVTTQYRSFTKPPTLIKWQSEIISDLVLKGNYIIQASGPVFIDQSCLFEDVILFASSVTVDDNFSGSLQVFARDTVIIGEGVNLFYPSAISLKDRKHSYLKIKDDTQIHGAIYVKPKNPNMNNLHCYVSKGSQLNGELIVEGVVEFRGSMNGYIACDQFVYSTASGKYQNYLVNAKISSTSLSKYYLPLLNDSNQNKKLLKRVQ